MFQIGKGDISTAPDQKRPEPFPPDALKCPPINRGDVDLEAFSHLIERHSPIEKIRVLHVSLQNRLKFNDLE
jgi:hypothetical protein